jgi:hypothetical protein
MGVRSAMNKRKQTMIYPWLLPMNVVGTMFDIAVVPVGDGFRKAGKRAQRAKQQRAAALHETRACTPVGALLRTQVKNTGIRKNTAMDKMQESRR